MMITVETYCCEKFVTVTDGWDKFIYAPTLSFERRRDIVTRQHSIPTSVVVVTVRTIDDPCRRTSNKQRYKNNNNVQQTIGDNHLNSDYLYRIPNSARRATHNSSVLLHSGTLSLIVWNFMNLHQNILGTFINTLGALTNILGTFLHANNLEH